MHMGVRPDQVPHGFMFSRANIVHMGAFMGMHNVYGMHTDSQL